MARIKKLMNRRLGKWSCSRGFTLIEVMVAALILLVAMAGIVPFFLTGLSQASSIRYKSMATNIARERMEEIRQLDYREIISPEFLASRFGSTDTQRGIQFEVTYGVQESAYEGGTLKKVTVNVGWTAPPEISPASITTMIHQQFLGPRGALLEVEPATSDPLGTPFPVIAYTTVAKYHLAQADWSLVFNNLDQPGMTIRNIYARLVVFDDNGASVPLGPSANDFRLDTSYLRYTTGADGKVNDVWFEHVFDAGIIPDGYWEMRAVAYNEYDQPGNVWRLRLRVERGAPEAPATFTATPQADNQTVVLTWLGGQERDRAYYVLERRKWEDGAWSGVWTQVGGTLDPESTMYTDVGSTGSATDPFGTDQTQNRYQYRLWAVDICNPGNAGAAVVAEALIPSVVTTTTTDILTTTTTAAPTTTTTSTSTTSTTLAYYSVSIKNSTNKTYSLSIQDGAGAIVYSGNVTKNSTRTVPNLAAGNYFITATTTGRPTVTATFALPAQAGQIVMTIL